MSLLDRGREVVTVYPEIVGTDVDGNIITKASNTGIVTRATVQPMAASGTSGRRAEQDNEGFETEENYRLRLPRRFPHVLGAQAKVSWRNQIWSVAGDHKAYNGSNRTRHTDYVIRRT